MKWSHHYDDPLRATSQENISPEESPTPQLKAKKEKKLRKKENSPILLAENENKKIVSPRTEKAIVEYPTAPSSSSASTPLPNQNMSGVVGIKILKKTKKRDRNDQVKERDEVSIKRKKKEELKTSIREEENPLHVLTHVSSSSCVSIGGGGMSQWD